LNEEIKSFEDRFVEYKGLLENYFKKRGFGDDSQDLAQTTFLKAYKNLHSLKKSSSFRAWLLKIARNTYLNYLRDQSTQKSDAVVISLDQESIGPDRLMYKEAEQPNQDTLSKIIAKEDAHRLRQALYELPDQMRYCVYLRIHQSLKYREIASLMQMEINTVKSQLYQAKSRLKEMLSEFEDDLAV
jgi:RNA polymerase sigma-70 factor (ECF subfamily)